MERKQKRKKKRPVLLASLKLGIQITGVVLIIVGLFTFVFGIHRINDTAMEPNLSPGDLILFYRIDHKYLVGDVVVYEYKGKTQIGRVVAMPKDKVEIDESGLKVNGSNQYEPKIYKATLAVKDGVSYPLEVGKKEIFVMADNREQAKDSRSFGPLPIKSIKGKVFSLLRRRGI